jgi:PAS domain S-box-containing protein
MSQRVTNERNDIAKATLDRLSQLAGQRFATSADATEAVLSAITDVVGMRTSWISKVDEEAGRLDIVAAHNKPGGSDIRAGSSAPIETMFCNAIIGPDRARLQIVEDVRNDPSFADSLAARSFPAIRSYVGVPIVLSNGTVHGTLCASDPVPTQVRPQQAQLLTVLSRLLATQIERDRESAARVQSEQLFDVFMDHTPAIAYMKDAAGRYIYVNRMMEKAFNLDQDWLIGKTDHDCLDVEAAQRMWREDQLVLRTGETRDFTEEIPGPDGQPRYWHSLKFPVTDASGQPFVAGISLDITERRAQELQRAMLAAIVQDTQDAIYSKTQDGIIRTWNPGAERLYGFSAGEMIGNSLDVLVPPGYPNDLALIRDRLDHGGRIERYETRRRMKDGRILDVELTISLIRDAEGKVVGDSTIARDITEHKRLIAERDRLYRDLQEEVARAAEIQAHLLPAVVPLLRGFEFAATCRPARDVGGDFFDWAETADGIRITLGDVTGKGMPAALLMATARAALRGAASQSVDEAITTVNRALMADFASSHAFVTMFHAELRADGRLTFTDAGHGMALIIRRDGTVEPLLHHELPIGIMQETRYTSTNTRLHEGETLIVYSDGLPDSRPDLLHSPASVAALCVSGMDANQMLEGLVRATEGRGPRPDDLTLIAVRRQERAA